MINVQGERFLSLLGYLGKMYESGTPIVSDQLYDLLLSLSQVQSYVKWESSGKVELPIPLGSVKTIEVSSILNDDALGKWLVEPKVDGVNLTVFRRGGALIMATRGDGTYGRDVTQHLKHLSGYFSKLHEGNWVNGEVYVDQGTYENLRRDYTSPRNMAASLLSRNVPSPLSTNLKVMCFLRSDGENVLNVPQTTLNVSELNDLPKSLPKEWSYLPMDGVVIQLPEKSYGISKQGYRTDRLAIKFRSEEAATEVKSVFWQMGVTGSISPVAALVPVVLNGQSIAKVTLHSLSWSQEKGIGVGAQVMVRRAGMIVPEVSKVLSKGQTIIALNQCPWCAGQLISHYRPECNNLACPERFRQAVRWVTSSKMFSTKENFIQVSKVLRGKKGTITMLLDSFRLWPQRSLLLDPTQAKQVKNLTEKKLMMITLLGIRGFSIKSASKLAKLSSSQRLTWLLNLSNKTVRESLFSLSKFRWGYLLKMLSVNSIKGNAITD